MQTVYASFNRSPRTHRDIDRHPEHTGHLLEAIGRPDWAFPAILVTGSKGKGSTSYFLSELLRITQQPVGLFTGPHLLDNLERIRIDGQPVTAQTFLDAFLALAPALRVIDRQLPPGQYLGPVGILAAVAAQIYARRGVKWAVFETGRGARFDDVAQIRHATAVVTALLPEHLEELGPGLSDIAWHKAGVIGTETATVILGDATPILEKAIRLRIKELGTQPNIILSSQRVRVTNPVTTAAGTRFDLEFVDGRRWSRLASPHVGPVIPNLALAVAAAEQLVGALPEIAVRRLTQRMRWPGRGEVLSTAPYVVLDAAIHPDSLTPWLASLSQPFDRAVLSVPEGKDRPGLKTLIERYSRQIFYTTCSNPRLSYDYRGLPMRPGDRLLPEVSRALTEALADLAANHRILLAGTLSFVADVYRHLGREVVVP